MNIPNYYINQLKKIFGKNRTIGRYVNDFETMTLYIDEYPIVEFDLDELEGQCGTAVLNNILVNKQYRKRGIGTLVFKLAEYIAKTQNYTTLLATDKAENIATDKIFKKLKWKKFHTFTNRNTDNVINMWVKTLRK